jgi:hypothetical protein
MNIALGAVILIILLLPGAAAINSYYSSFRAKQSRIAMPFNDQIFKGIVISFLIQCTGICTIRYAFKKDINLNLIYDIIIGKELHITNAYLATSFLDFGFYSFTLVMLAWWGTKWFKRFVQMRNLDINNFSLRTVNYWYIVFSARYLEGRNVRGRQSDTDLIFLDVLTTTNIIYSGILIDFNYSPQKDELENLILDSTLKRSFDRTEEDEETHKGHSTGKPCLIPGDAFVIPINTIVNINISYIEIEDMPFSDNQINLPILQHPQ